MSSSRPIGDFGWVGDDLLQAVSSEGAEGDCCRAVNGTDAPNGVAVHDAGLGFDGCDGWKERGMLVLDAARVFFSRHGDREVAR